MDEKKYRYKDVIPEERKEITKEWTVKAEKKSAEKKREAEECIPAGEEKKGQERIRGDESQEKTGEKEENASEGAEEGKENEEKSDDFDVDRTIEEARDSVKRAIEDVVDLGNTLLGTRKGRGHIEKKAKKAGKKLTRTLEYIIEDAGKKLKK
ncbi:hypothetical protein [Methanoplanus endosymbiosus]|uniref:Uncharacterized protein n=1 Tax=Methanoplanus endosymbiosus TaxID=33865 RepID=A0A9E7PK58_9EURY|nr:hypothetical protein [Methanoplanus endosymbiosus]UUX91520.1 hypothetical protein L6E24_09060 [Methanoplanus endosymbiosus]